MTEEKVQLTGDWLTVSEVLKEHASGFAAHGYELRRTTIGGSEKIRLFPIFELRNSRIRTSIDISFSVADQRRGGGFIVLIVRVDNRKMDVLDFMKEHGLTKYDGRDLTEIFRYRDPQTNIRQFAERFFSTLLALMDKELNPYVKGYRFEETPIDWQGQK